jgi:hypothetical protein
MSYHTSQWATTPPLSYHSVVDPDPALIMDSGYPVLAYKNPFKHC